jgi:hypothetical protein
MEKIKDAVAAVGEYNKGGEIKKRYQKVGSLFQRDDGSLSLKLESIPLSVDWNGWLNFYDPYNKREGQQQQQQPPQQQKPTQLEPKGQIFSADDEIPF